MTTTLVLGGAGFIGRPLARVMLDAGEVAILHRGNTILPDGVTPVVADRGDPTAVLAAVRQVRPDVVLDLLAMTAADTLPLFDRLRGEVGRYCLVSSADVYRNYSGLHRKAAPEPVLGLIGEDSPLRETRFPYRGAEPRPFDDPARWLDDYDKIPLEAALASGGLDWTVLRLPMVFGPADRQRRFDWILRPMLAGAARLVIPRRWADWRTSYGFVDDVAAGVALAARQPAAAMRTFNLGMADAPDHESWARSFAAALDWRGEIVVSDAPPEGPLGRAIAALDLSYPLALDTRRIRRELGYEEPCAEVDAIRQTAAS